MFQNIYKVLKKQTTEKKREVNFCVSLERYKDTSDSGSDPRILLLLEVHSLKKVDGTVCFAVLPTLKMFRRFANQLQMKERVEKP